MKRAYLWLKRCFTGVWLASPGTVQLEVNVIRWLCSIFELPSTSFGLIVSGGSIANWCAVVAARVAHMGEVIDPAAVVLCCGSAHYCVAKACFLAGLPKNAVRKIPGDENARLCADAVALALQEEV